MGTKLAPSYANLFMSEFEEKHVYTYDLQPKIWLRYIDDIFCIWQHGSAELEKFTTHLNKVHDTIKFTVEKSKTSVNFLDTTVLLSEKELETTLYVKPTDRNNYLPFDSAHPFHCKKGLPFGQFLRIRRICSSDIEFDEHCVRKAALMRQKGYPISLLKEAYEKASSKTRTDLLSPNQTLAPEIREKHPGTFLTTTYAPSFDGLKRQTRKTWDLLDRATSTRDIHDRGLTIGYRRPKNLRDILVRARLPPIQTPKGSDETHPTTKACKSKNCRYCPLLDRTGKIRSQLPKSIQRQLQQQQSGLLYNLHLLR